jgi:hypothetical protein
MGGQIDGYSELHIKDEFPYNLHSPIQDNFTKH